MAGDSTPAGKAKLSRLMSTHKASHGNCGLGPNSTPLTSALLEDWILDLLHVDLNLGKLTWKWALTRRLPVEVRTTISNKLANYGHPLDLRTKEEGRLAPDKFYDGGEWQNFIAGTKKAPPGATIVAELILVVANHYEQLAEEYAAATRATALAPPPNAAAARRPASTHAASKPTRKNARGGCVAYAASSSACGGAGNGSSRAPPSHSPATEAADPPPWKAAYDAAVDQARTEAELQADAASLAAIRQRYGQPAERLLQMMLTFDALFAFRETMRVRADRDEKVEHALSFAQKHRTWWEQLERVSLGQHKSFYPHRTQLTGPSQILEVADLWRYSLSALESFHAEVGRVADRTGCKRINADKEKEPTQATRRPYVKEGPARVVNVASSTTSASSVARRLVGAKLLSQSEELCIPMRAQARMQLAPEAGGGRVTAKRVAPKLGMQDHEVGLTVVSEFARLVMLQ